MKTVKITGNLLAVVVCLGLCGLGMSLIAWELGTGENHLGYIACGLAVFLAGTFSGCYYLCEAWRCWNGTWVDWDQFCWYLSERCRQEQAQERERDNRPAICVCREPNPSSDGWCMQCGFPTCE